MTFLKTYGGASGLLFVALVFYITYIKLYDDDNVEKRTQSRSATTVGILLSAMIGPFIFGFLDNFGMFIGADSVGELLGGKDATLQSLAGNTYSDFIGALMGSAISSMMAAFTAYDESQLNYKYRPIFEGFAIALGCLVPFLMKLEMLKFGKKSYLSTYTFMTVAALMIGLISYMLVDYFKEPNGTNVAKEVEDPENNKMPEDQLKMTAGTLGGVLVLTSIYLASRNSK